jgi:hypothetical protein
MERYKRLKLWEQLVAPIIVGVVPAVVIASLAIGGDDKPPRTCLSITAPKDHAKIAWQRGADIEGTICNSIDDVWIFNHGAAGGFYFRVNNRPVPVVGGQWIQRDGPIGDAADRVGTRYQIVAVRVPPKCSRAIERIPPSENNAHKIMALPPGCPSLTSPKVADTVVLEKAG